MPRRIRQRRDGRPTAAARDRCAAAAPRPSFPRRSCGQCRSGSLPRWLKQPVAPGKRRKFGECRQATGPRDAPPSVSLRRLRSTWSVRSAYADHDRSLAGRRSANVTTPNSYRRAVTVPCNSAVPPEAMTGSSAISTGGTPNATASAGAVLSSGARAPGARLFRPKLLRLWQVDRKGDVEQAIGDDAARHHAQFAGLHGQAVRHVIRTDAVIR